MPVKKLKRQRKSEPLKALENDQVEESPVKGKTYNSTRIMELHITSTPIASSLELVKAALHTAVPPVLSGRYTEISTISDFLIDHVIGHTPGSLYIAGPPGTGKTATVTKCLTNPKVSLV